MRNFAAREGDNPVETVIHTETREVRKKPLQVVAIEQANVAVAEAHDVVVGLKLGNADELADQCFADEDLAALPLDRARRAHAADLMIGKKVIIELKHNLNSTAKLQRLIGQLGQYEGWDGRVVGLTNPYGEAFSWIFLDNSWLWKQQLANGTTAVCRA